MSIFLRSLLKRSKPTTKSFSLFRRRQEIQYGVFRDDIAAKEGETRELVSFANKEKPGYLEKNDFNGNATLWEAF